MAVLFSKIVTAPYDVEGKDLQGNPVTSRFAVVELMQKYGMVSTRVKAGIFLEQEGIDEKDLLKAKSGDVFNSNPKAFIASEYIPGGYEINGKVVHNLTMYVSHRSSVIKELTRRGIEISVPDEAVEA